MKLTIDPMPALRAAREAAVNKSFNAIAVENLHRDHAHAIKRAEAVAIVGGAQASAAFAAEAKIRRITAAELAQLVLSKPDVAAQRELHRQQIMMRIAAASTLAELDNVGSGPAE